MQYEESKVVSSSPVFWKIGQNAAPEFKYSAKGVNYQISQQKSTRPTKSCAFYVLQLFRTTKMAPRTGLEPVTS